MREYVRPARALLLVAFLSFLAVAADAADPVSREFRECPDCPEMVAIPGGSFVMGSPADERGRFDSEGPQRSVAVRPFALGKYVVTVGEFLTFLRETGYQPVPCNPVLHLAWKSPGGGMAYSPGLVEPPRWPASCLNWSDARAYVAWLNDKVRRLPSAQATTRGKAGDGPYRLPSEAEWEYAARAGTTTARWWGEAIGRNNANCNGCGSRWDGTVLAPVGSFGPNAFGLYDVLGNVWQWVEDCWNESYVGAPGDGRSRTTATCTRRVLRGGSWSNVPAFVRSATRSAANAEGQDFDYSINAGFRVARNLP